MLFLNLSLIFLFLQYFYKYRKSFSILFSHKEKFGLSDEESIYLQNKNKTYLRGISEITRTFFW